MTKSSIRWTEWRFGGFTFVVHGGWCHLLQGLVHFRNILKIQLTPVCSFRIANLRIRQPKLRVTITFKTVMVRYTHCEVLRTVDFVKLFSGILITINEFASPYHHLLRWGNQEFDGWYRYWLSCCGCSYISTVLKNFFRSLYMSRVSTWRYRSVFIGGVCSYDQWD